MKVLVTGGTGFVGQHLVRALALQGVPVRALYRTERVLWLEPELAARVEWLPCDILDVQALHEAMDGCTHVYHTAAIIAYRRAAHRHMMQVNVQGTANVVNAARKAGIRKLVHVSSVAALGRARGSELVDEGTTWQPDTRTTAYGWSKRQAELEVFRGMAEGLPAVIVNPSLILGSGDWRKGPPNFFLRCRKGLRFCPSGGTGMVAVDDVVQIMIALMNAPVEGERFILNAEQWSFWSLFTAIADHIGAPRPWLRLGCLAMESLWIADQIFSWITAKKPALSREMARMTCRWSAFDNRKVCQYLGYTFMPIHQCIEQTAQNFLLYERLSKSAPASVG